MLEHHEDGNQQPSHICSYQKVVRDMEGSETNAKAKAITATRASRRDRRWSKEEYMDRNKSIAYDIVRAAGITNESAEAVDKEPLR
jgi:hypothetical protein